MGELSLSNNNYKGRPAVCLDMGSSLDIQNAEALAELLREAVSASQPVIIDASSVERVSTSAIQLILAADQALAATDCELALNNPSGSFLAAFADCGIQPEEMHWTVLPESADG